MQLKDLWKKITESPTTRKTNNKYHTVPVRNFYNSMLTADVFEKQKFFVKNT